jgi:hypothetical protein
VKKATTTLKNDLFSNDVKIALAASKKLAKVGGDHILTFLLELLESEKPGIRNLAALSLRDIGDNRAIAPLLQAIFKPENRNYIGTLVYALQTLECTHILVELFKILFYESFESKMGAYKILDEQEFEFSRTDLMQIQSMWKECSKAPSEENGFKDPDTKEMIQDAYEGFMEYLKEK